MSRHHSWPILPDGRQVRINATSHVLEVFDTDLSTLLHQTSSTGGLLYPFLKTAAGVVNSDITADITAGRLAVGDAIVTGSYFQGLTVGGNVYEVVAGATGTEDGGLYVNAGTLQLHGMVAESGMNATQWGAKADGTTDDTARIQAAINGIPLNSTLLLPDGSRCITTLTVARKIKLRGGRLSWTAGITNADAITVTADGVEFHDVTLINPNELGAATGNRNIGIRFTANEGTVSGCTIQQFQNGIMVSADGEWSRFRITDNRVIDVVGTGGGPSSASTDGEDRGDGIVVWGAQATITGNIVSARSGTDARIGIHCEGLPGFAGTPGNYSSAQYTISDNIVYGQFRRGISVEDVSEASVTGNTVADSTWWAVSLAANCRASHLTGNTILWTRAAGDNQGSAFSPQRGPIMAYGITHDSVIAGNTIRIAGTAAAAIIVQGVDSSNRGTDTLVTNNTWYVESGALTDGIKADNTARLRLAGNKGSGHTALGVNAFVADSIEIVGNHLRGGAGATFGIQTSGACTAALVDGNIHRNCRHRHQPQQSHRPGRRHRQRPSHHHDHWCRPVRLHDRQSVGQHDHRGRDPLRQHHRRNPTGTVHHVRRRHPRRGDHRPRRLHLPPNRRGRGHDALREGNRGREHRLGCRGYQRGNHDLLWHRRASRQHRNPNRNRRSPSCHPRRPRVPHLERHPSRTRRARHQRRSLDWDRYCSSGNPCRFDGVSCRSGHQHVGYRLNLRCR